MLYEMKCDVCGTVLDIGCPMNQHSDIIKPGIKHEGCRGILSQVITPARMLINRSAFPREGNEIQLPTDHGVDIRFQDKIHAREYLGERGLTSKWIENDM